MRRFRFVGTGLHDRHAVRPEMKHAFKDSGANGDSLMHTTLGAHSNATTSEHRGQPANTVGNENWVSAKSLLRSELSASTMPLRSTFREMRALDLNGVSSGRN